MKHTIRHLLIGLAILAVAGVPFALDFVLPYGFLHVRDIAVVKLKGGLSAWKGSSNDQAGIGRLIASDSKHLSTSSLSFTNEGRRIQSVIRYDDPRFRGRGYLVGTVDGDVFWVSDEGAIEQLPHRKRSKEQVPDDSPPGRGGR